MFWFSNEISCFTIPKISHSEYSSPSTVPYTVLAHSPLYLPLRASVHPGSISIIQSVLDHPAIRLRPVCHCAICPQLTSGLHIHDQIWVSSIYAEHPIALEVGVIVYQLTTWGALYNSKSSKPNGSASSFDEAQLDDIKLRFAATALRSCQNVQRTSVGQSDSNTLGDSSKQGTSTPGNIENLVLTVAFVRYNKEDLWTMTSSA